MHDEKRDRMVNAVVGIMRGDLAGRDAVSAKLMSDLKRTNEAGIAILRQKAAVLKGEGSSDDAIASFLDTASQLAVNECLLAILAPVLLDGLTKGGTA